MCNQLVGTSGTSRLYAAVPIVVLMFCHCVCLQGIECKFIEQWHQKLVRGLACLHFIEAAALHTACHISMPDFMSRLCYSLYRCCTQLTCHPLLCTAAPNNLFCSNNTS